MLLSLTINMNSEKVLVNYLNHKQISFNVEFKNSETFITNTV